jgi:hypothetical protein
MARVTLEEERKRLTALKASLETIMARQKEQDDRLQVLVRFIVKS